MGTVNSASSTNNSNVLVYSFSTAIDRVSAWKASSTVVRGYIIPHSYLGQAKLRSLGVGITSSNPFTNKTS